MAIFILTLLAVAGAFALYQWGGNVLLKEATPKGHFAAPKAGGGPDYTELSSWVAKPGMTNDPALWVPDGTSAGSRGDAAVFYIHPTTYLENDRWNAPLIPGGETEFRTDLFVKSQASAFNEAGEIWAPRYRQAAFGAFLLKSEDAEQALGLAYSDVSRAFDEFLKHVAPGQPIILAGHSQGALHLMHLLRDRHNELKGRLVAAYVVGWPIDTAADLPALGFPACTTPDQTGCILSWMSFGDPPNASMMLDQWKKTPGLDGHERSPDNALCVNPISGVQNGTAPPQDNLGTLIPTANLTSATLAVGRVGAHCHDGLLILDGDIPAFPVPPIFGNNYHVYDYALFWGSIRQDADRRLAAWR